MYLVVDEKSRFREEIFQKAMAVLQADGGEEEGGGGKKKGGGGRDGGKGGQQSELGKIVRLIMERSYDPVIIFSFSKRECEAYALKMSKLDFNEEGEKELVEQVGGEGGREGGREGGMGLCFRSVRGSVRRMLKISKLDFNEEGEKELVEEVRFAFCPSLPPSLLPFGTRDRFSLPSLLPSFPPSLPSGLQQRHRLPLGRRQDPPPSRLLPLLKRGTNTHPRTLSPSLPPSLPSLRCSTTPSIPFQKKTKPSPKSSPSSLCSSAGWGSITAASFLS